MEQGDFALDDRDFSRIKARLYQAAGISMSDAKRTLVLSRLSRILREGGFSGFSAYLDYLDQSADGEARQAFINALTTNLTRFWREDHHFDHLVAHIGEVMKAGGPKRLRLWSAGCSTGQEAFSMAMSLVDAYPELLRWDFRVLATDIDTRVLAEGAAGTYAATELNGLSAGRARLFEHLPDGRVRVPGDIRSIVQFKPLNLVAATWPMRGPFDAIFCRNVAIYFDKKTQVELFRRLGDLLRPGGYLYIGHSENPGVGESRFRSVGKTIYQTRPGIESRSAA